MDVILKRFEQPDEVRTFELGRFELVTIGGMTIGRATYQPGWRWSSHVGPALAATSKVRTLRNPPEPSGTFRNLPEPSGTM